mmetsp:Transcript_102084/g.164521  ORF Transcript_102084/g.164521 Transcript_102084/m.164521 type:complete len:102 (-) Transcript_102084:328-633(-)
MDALSAVLETLQWFEDQNDLHDDQEETIALRDQVLRMGPVLNPLTSARGLDRAVAVLDNLGACLGQARHIYKKISGWMDQMEILDHSWEDFGKDPSNTDSD